VLDQEPLTLAHPRVQAAKAKYEKTKYRRKISLTFEQLFDYFQADCIRIEAIAEEAGVTRPAIEAIYKRHFLPLFDKKLIERRQACILEQELVKKARCQAEFFSEPCVAKVVAQAQEAGHSVEAAFSFSHGYVQGVLRKALVVSGQLCSFFIVRKAMKIGRSSYARATLSFSTAISTRALIGVSDVEGFESGTFVLPAPLLLERLSFATVTNIASIYLPLNKEDRQNRPRLIPYWEYKDAWHLLPKPKEDPPAS
jgi:hypothetical protein